MGEQWCCGGPAAEMGYVDQARRFAEHNLANWRSTGTKRVAGARPARLHHLHRGLPEVLRRRLRHRDRPGGRAFRRPDPAGPADPDGAGRAGGDLPRPVPAEQAQGHLGRAARDPARHPGSGVHRRRPGDPVVLLLRRRRRSADREARADRGDQREPAGQGGAARRRHPGQRLPLVGTPAGRGRRGRTTSTSSTSTNCWPSRSGSPSAAAAGAGHDAGGRTSSSGWSPRCDGAGARADPDVQDRPLQPGPGAGAVPGAPLGRAAARPGGAADLDRAGRGGRADRQRPADPGGAAGRRHRPDRRRGAAARRHRRRRQADEPDPRARPGQPHRHRRHRHQHAQAERGTRPGTA